LLEGDCSSLVADRRRFEFEQKRCDNNEIRAMVIDGVDFDLRGS
jgi:hypothetical protein